MLFAEANSFSISKKDPETIRRGGESDN